MEVCGRRAGFVSESCELCLVEGLSTQANGYCNDCAENMCNKCFQHHIKGKFCRNHVLSPLGQSMLHSKKHTGSNEKCKTHVRENIKYYCRKHDMVTCGDCNVADHQGCKVEFISNLANQFENSSEFKDIVRKIEKLEAEQKDNKTQLDSYRKKNEACLDTALAEIKQFRKYINEHLDQVEKEIIIEANKMAKQNDDIIDQVEKMLSEAEQGIGDIRNSLDANMIQDDQLFIRTKEYKPKIIKAGEDVSLIRKRNEITCFTFEQEKQLADMVKSGVKLGCLRRDNVTEKKPIVIQKTKQPDTVKPVMPNVKADKQVEAKQSYPDTVKVAMPSVKSDKQVEAKQSYPDTVKVAMPSGKADKQVETKQSYRDTVKVAMPSVKADKQVEAKQSYSDTVKPVMPSVKADKQVDAKQSYPNTAKPVMPSVKADKQVEEKQSYPDTVKPVMPSVKADKQVDTKQSYLLTAETPTVIQKNLQSIETVKPILFVTAEKNIKAKQSYLPPDPRAAGFDFGSRVKDISPLKLYRYGTVKQIGPSGYVIVRWDSGCETMMTAGADGLFTVKLLNK